MDRTIRISEEVRRELSELIREIKDPRLPLMTSITNVKVTKDLRYADVWFSVLGKQEDISKAAEALESASGFLRRELAHRLSLRYTPELRFKSDDSIEHGVYMSSLINKTVTKDNNNKE